MQKTCAGDSPLKRVINFVTFVDLPIRKKFILFAVGVLFWFIVMYVLTMATIFDMNTLSGDVTGDVIPWDKTTNKIIHKLQHIHIEAAQIDGISDSQALNHKMGIIRLMAEDVRSYLLALELGGQVNDIRRDTGKLVESYTVEGIDSPEGVAFVADMNPKMDALFAGIADIEKLKADSIRSGSAGTDVSDKVAGLQEGLSAMILMAENLSGSNSRLYESNAGRIRFDARCTTYTVSGVLIIASALLSLFTIWISRSIARPVKSIIDQIRSLGEGEVDLSKRIEITAKDEIGTLSQDFNQLMEEIHGMNTFKKVIEEDESLEDVYARLGKVFSETFGLYDFIIYEVSNSQNKMRPVFPLILNDSDINCNEEILSDCSLCRAKKTGHLVSSILYPRMCKQFRTELDKEHVCIPMIVGGSTGGVVQFLFDSKVKMDEKDRRIYKAEQYIKESLSVIEAKRLMNTLKESALKDPLTGLYNRRFLQEYTETLVAGILRRDKSVGLIMCDLDYFKQVNDVYGHNVGDAVLRETSGIIRKSIRASDIVIRFGGEEFLVVLLDIREGDSMMIAEKIRDSIQQTQIKVPDGILKKTISLGVSEFPGDTKGFWQAIKFADVALYKAKETGRNRAVRFTKGMWTEEQF